MGLFGKKKSPPAPVPGEEIDGTNIEQLAEAFLKLDKKKYPTEVGALHSQLEHAQRLIRVLHAHRLKLKGAVDGLLKLNTALESQLRSESGLGNAPSPAPSPNKSQGYTPTSTRQTPAASPSSTPGATTLATRKPTQTQAQAHTQAQAQPQPPLHARSSTRAVKYEDDDFDDEEENDSLPPVRSSVIQRSSSRAQDRPSRTAGGGGTAGGVGGVDAQPVPARVANAAPVLSKVLQKAAVNSRDQMALPAPNSRKGYNIELDDDDQYY